MRKINYFYTVILELKYKKTKRKRILKNSKKIKEKKKQIKSF